MILRDPSPLTLAMLQNKVGRATKVAAESVEGPHYIVQSPYRGNWTER